jgi:hypothetical protein
LKLALLRQDAFAFFRGTNPLFLESLRVDTPCSMRLACSSAAICIWRISARSAAGANLRAWQAYSKDYDAGAVKPK